MSEFLKVLLLSVLQGVAEFLPISSSGHLVAAKTFLGIESEGVSLELALHAGTLVSVCIFYVSILRTLFLKAIKAERAAWRYLGAILVSMVPAGLVYVLLDDWIESAFETIQFVGPALILTGILLLTTRRGESGVKAADDAVVDVPSMSVWTALWMGIGQAVAMLPGVSRSGTTIWVARLCRVPAPDAARFSFLMSVPVIGGACFLKGVKALVGGAEEAAAEAAAVPGWVLGVGALVAAVVGYASLCLLVRLLNRGRFWIFGLYCLAVGLAIVVFA